MKKPFNLVALLLLAGNISVAQQIYMEFPKLTGPYLGQKLPGTSPEMFAPGIISTGMGEACATFSSDGKECFFMVMVNGHEAIVHTEIANGYWTAPEVAPFSGKYYDGFPSLQPDGSRLFFHSNRPIENGAGFNIWFVEKTDQGWSEAKAIGAPVNGKHPALCPSVSRTGTIYFTRTFDSGEELIYRSKCINGSYLEPEKMPENINTRKMQFHPAISPDESCLVLPLAGRDDAITAGDNYYVSFRDDNDNWSELINMGKEINGKRVWGISSFSPDGKFFFLSARPSFMDVNVTVFDKVMNYRDLQEMTVKNPAYDRADIYWVDAKIIDELKPNKLN
jgi:hypothetical protein